MTYDQYETNLVSVNFREIYTGCLIGLAFNFYFLNHEIIIYISSPNNYHLASIFVSNIPSQLTCVHHIYYFQTWYYKNHGKTFKIIDKILICGLWNLVVLYMLLESSIN